MTDRQDKKKGPVPIYRQATLTSSVAVSIGEIGSNIRQVLEQHIANRVHNRCQTEGYIRSDSVSILEYSAGVVQGTRQIFQVVYECMICNPAEGAIIEGITVEEISLAGIRGLYRDPATGDIPMEVMLMRDFHFGNAAYDKLKEGDTFTAKVIFTSYELNDAHVTVSGTVSNEPY